VTIDPKAVGPDGKLLTHGDVYVTGVGQIITRVHPPDACAVRACAIHNPSGHHMRSWPTNFRSRWEPGSIKPDHMERICPHGIGHPDPDDLAYQKSIGNGDVAVHGCDGCCEDPGDAG
jgi:hypothetical protein